MKFRDKGIRKGSRWRSAGEASCSGVWASRSVREPWGRCDFVSYPAITGQWGGGVQKVWGGEAWPVHADQGSGHHLPDSREAPKGLTCALTEAEKADFQGEEPQSRMQDGVGWVCGGAGREAGT